MIANQPCSTKVTRIQEAYLDQLSYILSMFDYRVMSLLCILKGIISQSAVTLNLEENLKKKSMGLMFKLLQS